MANKQDTDISLLINDVEDDALVEELAEAGEFEDGQLIITPDDEGDLPFMPVGSIFVSAIPLTDARVHLLDGSTIPQDGIYADFANLIKSLVATGNNIAYDTNEEFDADVSSTGNCGKFVIDNTNGTIRLPKITTFIQGLTDFTNIGSSLSAGLPNITGSAGNISNVHHFFHQDGTKGAFSVAGSTGGLVSASAQSQYAFYPRVDFNANNGATTKGIYGNSETVQPNATQFPYYIVLASGYKSSALVKFDNIMTELNYILKKMYPVGSIYTSNDLSNSPMSVLGFGTWERVKDRFILGVGDTYSSVDAKGGYTDSIVVSHRHDQIYVANYYLTAWTSGSGISALNWTGGSSSSSGQNMLGTNTVGASGAGRNMPPYLTVYMWQRVE